MRNLILRKACKVYKSLLVSVVLALTPGLVRADMVGKLLDWSYTDSVFTQPFIDIDEMRELPVPHRYLHGGFADGTRFSMYLPAQADDYEGRFFQYASPFPDSETSAQNGMLRLSPFMPFCAEVSLSGKGEAYWKKRPS